MYRLFPIALLLIALPAQAQERDASDEVFVVVEQQPEMIGGLEGLQQKIRYPSAAKANGIEGTAIVQFVVDERGAVVDPECVRNPDDALCDEALRVVQATSFTPGRQSGEVVKVQLTLPIKFVLSAEKVEDR